MKYGNDVRNLIWGYRGFKVRDLGFHHYVPGSDSGVRELVRAHLMVKLSEECGCPPEYVDLDYEGVDLMVRDAWQRPRLLLATSSPTRYFHDKADRIAQLFDQARNLLLDDPELPLDALVYFSRATSDGVTREYICAVDYRLYRSYADWVTDGSPCKETLPRCTNYYVQDEGTSQD